jgi:hypothetical protein
VISSKSGGILESSPVLTRWLKRDWSSLITLQEVSEKPPRVRLRGYALSVALNRRNIDYLRPQFDGARVLPSRILEAQTLYKGPVHILLGGISKGKDGTGECAPTLTNSLQRSRISSFSHQVPVTWAKPSQILCQTKSVVAYLQQRMTKHDRSQKTNILSLPSNYLST